MVEQPLDFFISYTGRDQAWATWMAQRLELAGYRVVLQAWDFGPGNFLADMEQAVQQAKRLIAIVSEPYISSKWSRQEWTAYWNRSDALVIPVQIEDTITPSMLRTLQRINLVGLREQNAGEKLLHKIAELAEPPKHEPLDLCVPKTYATWADVLRLAVGSGPRLVPGRRVSGADPAEGATILGLWA